MNSKRQELEEYYHDLVMNCPIEKITIWNIECDMRNIVEKKGYDLINFCTFPLFIKGEYMGNYNSIKGYSKPTKYLYYQLRNYGCECYFRENYRKPSESCIIFPKNLIYELSEFIKYNLKSYMELE